MPRSPKELADAYYESWRTGRPLSPDLFAENLVFVAPMGTVQGRDAFLASLGKLGVAMKLERIRREFVDGEDVLVVYDTGTPAGVIPMAEWIHTEKGRIARLEVFFDPGKLGPPRAG